MEKKISVLYVDDEENNLISFKATFRLKYKVYTALSGAEAIQLVKEKPVDVIITDQRMPKMTGVEFLEEIIKVNPEPMRILLTGYADLNAVVEAVNKGKIFHYLSKPWSEAELEETIDRAYEVYNERKTIKETFSKLETTNEQLEFLLRQKLLS
ncbi:Response regulator receiver domain-containing protein [Parapedobacter composti]|uniref:Response regulator receiver domain-containing protein n=1 Tax=Parapedobacter composti TaxID=623281 RepID=A0A1I1I531_9SPHI|nr:response regulator [Parapedobacter composti]SFC31549.1 Response regulator receiver domain-containing protein [Parapedobacter composti]